MSNLNVPGRWYCPLCGFEQYYRMMDAQTGGVVADAEGRPDPCPNDGAHLQPMTYPDALRNTEEIALAAIERQHEAERALEILRADHAKLADIVRRYLACDPAENAGEWCELWKKMTEAVL